MPTAPVDDTGNVLYYEDSGVSEDLITYPTVVLIHGGGFHGGIFQRLLPYAAAHGLRIVRVNMRDYRGSSNLTKGELAAITNGDAESQATVLEDLGRQIAAFLEYFSKTHAVPRITEINGKVQGGIILIPWSIGCMFATSMLGHALSLSESTKESLDQYLRTVILLDAVSDTTCGVPSPRGVYIPFEDLSLSAAECARLGAIWLSYYFTPVPDLDVVTDELLASRVGQHESITSQEGIPDIDKAPTLLKMSAEEIEAVRDPEAIVRTSMPFLRMAPSVYARNFEKAYFDTNGVLPRVNIVVAWGAETFPHSVWAAKAFLDRMKAEQPLEKRRRDITFYRLVGCNHFAHWDQPEKIIELITSRA